MKNSADYLYPHATRQQNIRAIVIVGTVSVAICVIVFLAQLTMGVPDEPQSSPHEPVIKSNP